MFDCIGIAVEKIEPAIEFCSLLGLRFVQSSPDHFEAKTQSGIRIMLDTVSFLKKVNPNWKKTENPSTTLGFAKESTTEVDELCNLIKNSGYQIVKKPWDAFWGQRYACVLDPDGNQIDIFAPIGS
jgi:uncharacterized glyoxalase superfamily protein PhnB